MDISMIVAVARNGVIGFDGGIPWHVSEDSRYFKKVTMGKPVIMGRKTWESLGKPLPGRDNIIVSRSLARAPTGGHLVDSLEAGLRLAKESGAKEAMIMGGAGLYDEGRCLANRVYFTEIHDDYEGDTWFSDLDADHWSETSRAPPRDRKPDDPDYSFVVYERNPV
jgi:dihydrofolate reductase